VSKAKADWKSGWERTSKGNPLEEQSQGKDWGGGTHLNQTPRVMEMKDCQTFPDRSLEIRKKTRGTKGKNLWLTERSWKIKRREIKGVYLGR